MPTVQLPWFLQMYLLVADQVSEGKNQNSLGGFMFINVESVGTCGKDSF